MNRGSILYKSILAHRRKLLLATGTTAVTGASYFTEEESSLPSLDDAGKRLDTNPYALSSALGFYTTTTECKAAKVKDSIPSTIVIPTRDEQLSKLKAGETFDILVIGGGATGSGAALDAATRGLSVAMIERGDFGNETSARSTKLIWAGIRYIATGLSALLRFHNVIRPVDAISDFVGEFKMVMGAHKERRIMLENNPHLTNWVPIAIPFTSWVSWPAPFGHPIFSTAPMVMPLVMKFYDGMSGFTCPPSHIMGRNRAARKFPQLDQNAKYFSIFYEGQHNDSRTNTYIALTAAEEGATVANYVEMIDLLKDKDGKAIGIECRDNLSGKTFKVYAKAIVFAGGPFTDSLRKMEDKDSAPAVNAAAGTHIVLPKYFCPAGIGMLDINTSDGRFLFFLPWEGHTLIGTTDRKGPAESSYGPPEQEIRYLLDEVQKYLAGDIKVRRSDVLSAWQGYRPLASDPNAPPGAPISRDHTISVNPKTGVTFITGGKWTTYREMAEDVINRVVSLHQLNPPKESSTATRPLRGGVGYRRNLPITLVQDFGVSEESAKHLARTYGMNAVDVVLLATPTSKRWPRFGNVLIEGFPYLECEIPYICKHEMVCTLTDMLTLRMRVAYLNKDAAIAAAPKVADLMAKELGWSRREKKRQLDEALEVLGTFGGPIPDKAAAALELSAEVQNVREVFEKLDLGGTGYIDLIEFMDCCTMLGVSFKNREKAKKAFKSIDLNADGKIDEDEFVAWWEKGGNLQAQIANKFKFKATKETSVGAAFG
mmetsp:Transcript_17911/g.44271  ORF Transcript_17911/g.44271 Transcript_17911/m.44271 type:complete len:769 (-) Transcript_17911:1995-4301(-)